MAYVLPRALSLLSLTLILPFACRPAAPQVARAPTDPLTQATESAPDEHVAVMALPPTVAQGTVPTAPPPSASPLVGRPLPELRDFYDQLDALRAGTSTQMLRVLWLGDSHTNADFMTERVRAHLQALGGAGGPGFVRVGLPGYRHEGVSLEVSGRWRKQPILPAQRTRVLDGVFGYGGIRTIPLSGGSALVSPRPFDGSVAAQSLPITATNGEDAPGGWLWQLRYRLPPGAALDVQLGAQAERLVAPAGLVADELEPIRALSLRSSPGERLRVSHRAGEPELFGVFVEGDRPAVVLDTVGIDGARAATALAWQPQQLQAEVAARSPALLVLAFGTNEVFDKTAVGLYQQQLASLVDVVRGGMANVPCWIIGPMDAPGENGVSRRRVAEVSGAMQAAARQAGCAFTSAQAQMGGEGSYARWRAERPALARTDGIHLTIAGYRELGNRLAQALVTAPSTQPVISESVP
jgi:lysophospholipase L1-like esterase